MSAGWNRQPAQRERARRLWESGRSAREICGKLHVPRNTLLHWRWEDQWTSRKAYKDRPITNAKASADATPTLWRCEHCDGRSLEEGGHPECKAAA